MIRVSRCVWEKDENRVKIKLLLESNGFSLHSFFFSLLSGSPMYVKIMRERNNAYIPCVTSEPESERV